MYIYFFLLYSWPVYGKMFTVYNIPNFDVIQSIDIYLPVFGSFILIMYAHFVLSLRDKFYFYQSTSSGNKKLTPNTTYRKFCIPLANMRHFRITGAFSVHRNEHRVLYTYTVNWNTVKFAIHCLLYSFVNNMSLVPGLSWEQIKLTRLLIFCLKLVITHFPLHNTQ